MKDTSENSLADKCTRLLEEVSSLLEKRHVDMKTGIERLLKESQPHFERIRRNELLTAPRFNVFRALGVIRKEVIQSRFLVYLLSPCEQHKQGSKFLNAFLERIGADQIAESNWALVKVRPEGQAEELGRMDIVITAPDLLIVIENKVNAKEQHKQMARYQEWMDKQRYATKKLVFLTPDRRKSESDDKKSPIVPYLMSYEDLAEIFSPLIPTIIPCSVRAVIEQYITACRFITLGEIAMTTPDNNLIALLTKQDNLKLALEIEQQMSFARQKIAEEFCAKVLFFFIEILNKSGINNWSAVKATDVFYKIKISHDHQSNYYLLARHIFTNDARYGECAWVYDKRPLSGSAENGKLEDLIKRMRGDGLGNRLWGDGWMCIKDLRENENKTGYMISSNEDMLACFEDNQNNEHPLAKGIADKIWTLFKNYHANIEALTTAP